jgi:hypothetical protein
MDIMKLYWALDNNRNIDESTRLTSPMYLQFDINKWLKITGRAGINIDICKLVKNWRSKTSL